MTVKRTIGDHEYRNVDRQSGWAILKDGKEIAGGMLFEEADRYLDILMERHVAAEDAARAHAGWEGGAL
jgi:hypothetical protein